MAKERLTNIGMSDDVNALIECIAVELDISKAQALALLVRKCAPGFTAQIRALGIGKGHAPITPSLASTPDVATDATLTGVDMMASMFE